MEQQPFYIGQKVVCVKVFNDNAPGVEGLIKGRHYTVKAIEAHFHYEGAWAIGIEEGPDPDDRYHHSQFAPLNPPRVSAIPELLTEPVRETLDVIKQIEKV